MNQLEQWWSANCHSAMLNGVQLVKNWENDLLKMSLPESGEKTLTRQLQSLGDLTKSLWAKFNNNRAELDRDYMSDEKMLVAYLAAFFIPNIERTRHIARSPRVQSVLFELMNQDTLEILDFGSGPLSSSFGILIAMGEIASLKNGFQNKLRNIHITATERSEKAFKIGSCWLENVIDSRITLQLERITSIPKDKRFDIAIASNVFNEIPEKHQLKTFLMLKNAVKSESKNTNSLLLAIEPGQELHSRRLISLRDQAIESGNLNNFDIIAPCPHQMPCPLSPSLERTDWCWFRCRFDIPAFQQELDKKSQLDHSELAYSYLALSPKPSSKKPWSICVSDEMSVGNTANLMKRVQYFSNNLLEESKISSEQLNRIAKDGLKTKLCCSNGRLLAGLRENNMPESKLQRGDEIDDQSRFETIISER